MAAAMVAATGTATRADAACKPGPGILPVTRVVEIDASTGPLFGAITANAKEKPFLRPREVVITFDDGPLPGITRPILDTLDRHCAKATFFSVGRMAVAYPDTVSDILRRGHTLGSHTWSHPLNLRRLKRDAAINEIEKGFAGVAGSAGAPIAPFFRFPGLSDSPALLAHLQQRQVATFTVDVVSNDSYIHDPNKLLATTLARVEAQGGGIILLHDIKTSTAKMLPALLTALSERGYKLVHMTSKDPFDPLPEAMAEIAPFITRVTAARDGGQRPRLSYGATGAEQLAVVYDAPVTRVASLPKDFLAGRTGGKTLLASAAPVPGARPKSSATRVASAGSSTSSWTATTRPSTPPRTAASVQAQVQHATALARKRVEHAPTSRRRDDHLVVVAQAQPSWGGMTWGWATTVKKPEPVKAQVHQARAPGTALPRPPQPVKLPTL